MKKWLKEKWFFVLSLLIALSVPFVVPDEYFFQVITMSCLFAIGALGLNLILGYTGQASLAHGGFFAIGAYGVAILTYTFKWSFWLALPVSALLAAFIGFLVGLPALRTRGAYFAITTLCLGQIIYLIAGNWVDLTGGHNGMVDIPPPSPLFGGLITFETQTAKYYLVLIFLLMTIFVMHRLINSLKGLTFMSVRNNEELAASLGINTFRTKILSFVVANFFAGLAGGIYVSIIGNVSPSVASLKLTFDFLLYVMLGGVATLAGPVIGSFAIPVLSENLQIVMDYQMMIFGLLLILVIIFLPRGLMDGIMMAKKKILNIMKRK